MKIKNFLVLTLGIFFPTNLISAATPQTGKEIAEKVYGPLPLNAFKSHIIPNLLNAIVPNSPCAISKDVDAKDQGFFLGRTENTNELFAIDFEKTLFTADNLGKTHDNTAITFITKIETVLKIQFIETYLKNLDKMDFTGITNDSLQILKDIKQAWNDKNMTKLVDELNKLKFFKDDSGIGFIKADSTLVKEASDTPEDSLLNKLFATGVDMFGVKGLTPELLLKVIHFKVDLTNTTSVDKIESLGKAFGLNDGTVEKETSSVATALLKNMQTYVTDKLNIKFFDGKGYGETDCQTHLFYNDIESKSKYYTENDYNNAIKPQPMPGSPITPTPTQNQQTGGTSINDTTIINYLKNDTVSTALKTIIDKTIDNLEQKTTKTPEENDQLTALKVFQNQVVQNSTIDATQIMKYLENSENLNAFKTALNDRIATLRNKTNATDAEKAQLKILEQFSNKTEEPFGYIEIFTKGTNGNKAFSIGIPLGTFLIGGFGSYLMLKNQSQSQSAINYERTDENGPFEQTVGGTR